MATDQGIRRRRLLPCSPCFALGLLYVSRQAFHRPPLPSLHNPLAQQLQLPPAPVGVQDRRDLQMAAVVHHPHREIGRASCRERVVTTLVGVTVRIKVMHWNKRTYVSLAYLVNRS